MTIHKRTSGFTLIELLVVIAIIGTLVAMILPAVQAAREAARRATCLNKLKQIGLALHGFHDTKRRLPAGWIATDAEGGPGWGWAAMLLPYLEEENLYKQHLHLRVPIDDPENELIRSTALAVFLCPSDPEAEMFELPFGGEDEHEHAGVARNEPLPAPVARANYVGMFGTEEIEHAPDDGDGVFYQNSRIRFRDLRDGLSKTIVVGERSSRIDKSMWVGVVAGADEAMARVVGSADHAPNDPHNHFEDFSSEHTSVTNFLFGDGSVQAIDDEIDLEVYHALATRDGDHYKGHHDHDDEDDGEDHHHD